MGVMAERAVRFVIAASIALGILCLEGWWRIDYDPPLTTSGLHVHAFSSLGDGLLVLTGSAVIALLGLTALIERSARRIAGAAIAVDSIAMLALIVYDIANLPPGYVNFEFVPQPHYYATPILYFAAVTNFLIALAGAVLTLAPTYHVEHIRGEAWA